MRELEQLKTIDPEQERAADLLHARLLGDTASVEAKTMSKGEAWHRPYSTKPSDRPPDKEARTETSIMLAANSGRVAPGPDHGPDPHGPDPHDEVRPITQPPISSISSFDFPSSRTLEPPEPQLPPSLLKPKAK